MHALVVTASALGLHPLAGRLVPVGILTLSLLAALWLALGARGGPHAAAEDDAAPITAGIAIAARLLWWLGVGASVLALCSALLLPIVAYDAVAYRLPVIAQWLDLGRIEWVHTDDAVRNGYPLGQEAISAVIAAATGGFRFAGAISIVFVLQGALALAHLARACGVRSQFAHAASGLFLIVPMTVLNEPSAYVDAAFAGATVAWLCTLCAFACDLEPRREMAIAAGLSGALVLALKGTGVAFVVAPLFVMALYSLWGRYRRAGSISLSIVGLSSWALLCLVICPGAFWALRNVIHTGNPLWPVTLSVAGFTVFPGQATMAQVLDVTHNTPTQIATLPAALRTAFTWLQLSGPAVDFDDRLAGLGYAWPLFALPAVVWVLVQPLRAQRRRLLPVASVILLTALCLVLQPMNWWPRYTLWLWGAGALALAASAEAVVSSHAQNAVIWVQRGMLALLIVSGSEGIFALCHVQGAQLALSRGARAGDLALAFDVRRGLNA
ncbi:MAG TPA: hypothetical protein VL137_08420, partial [Polyangiaceae bacterium]|nr:hypothetical protein [Polyangiaceae bacterium]